MPVKNYYTVNGKIIGEKIAGGSRVDYLSDALGNVTGTVDQSANVINTYRYKPYGELLAKTGSGSDPSFGWVGTLGYRKTSRRFSEQYVRARHYGTSQGQWTTVDPLWPTNHQYNYAISSPCTSVDPSGLSSLLGLACLAQKIRADFCDKCKKENKLPSKAFGQQWDRCAHLAINRYCSKYGYITLQTVMCWILTESSGKPKEVTDNQYRNHRSDERGTPYWDWAKGKKVRFRDAWNRGLLQISESVWRQAGCDDDIGEYFANVYDPCKNIQCALKALCSNFKGQIRLQTVNGNRIGWGTEAPPGGVFECCVKCESFFERRANQLAIDILGIAGYSVSGEG